MESLDQLFKSLGPEFAMVCVILTVLYKLYRLIKVDNRQDSFHDDEQDFRKVLLDEVEKLRKDREELIRSAIPVEKRIFRLESNCASLRSYCRRCVTVLKSKTFSQDPEIAFLIKKGEELMDSSSSSRVLE